jgi:hypothetical protein
MLWLMLWRTPGMTFLRLGVTIMRVPKLTQTMIMTLAMVLILMVTLLLGQQCWLMLTW